MELRGVRGGLTSLHIGGVLLERVGSVGYILKDSWAAEQNVTGEGTGSAELWLSAEGGSLTWRIRINAFATPSTSSHVPDYLRVAVPIIGCVLLAALGLVCMCMRERRDGQYTLDPDNETKELLALFANPQLNRQAQAFGLRPLSFVSEANRTPFAWVSALSIGVPLLQTTATRMARAIIVRRAKTLSICCDRWTSVSAAVR